MSPYENRPRPAETRTDLIYRLMLWKHALAFVLLAVAAAATQAQPSAKEKLMESLAFARPAQVYQLALEARTAKDYPEMMFLLRRAASAGDRDAQELLGGILLAGPSVYGKALKADVCEAAHWIEQARRQGSIVADNQSLVLNNMFSIPNGWSGCKGSTAS